MLCDLPRQPAYAELAPEKLRLSPVGTDMTGTSARDEPGRWLLVELVRDHPFGGTAQEPPSIAPPSAEREFVVTEGEAKGHFDFPGRFLRLGSLLERVED